MPTVQVAPDASELLQDVANRLAKSRKVVVITGAGISTNSGIPDFRSEHGLYSLIQAQFDKANTSTSERENNSTDSEDTERPTKRRKLSTAGDVDDHGLKAGAKKGYTSNADPNQTLIDDQESCPQDEVTVASCSNTTESHDHDAQPATSNNVDSHRSTRTRSSLIRRPSLPRHSTTSSTQSGAEDSTFSQPEISAASSQTDEIIVCPESIDTEVAQRTTPTPKRLFQDGPMSSSPLSSPPAVFSDPYGCTNSTESSSPSESESGDESDSEGTQSSGGLFASQATTSKLRNMKGRDLFDANIWSDPVKTSVFYRFATTLRQKVKDVQPTSTHHFIAQLRDNGKLARVYTQNIDEIEKKIGLSTDLRNGAGNKRRKPTRQSTVNEQDKENTESSEQPSGEDDPGGKDATQSSQQPDDDEQNKSKSSGATAKGVECVFLHGSLHALRCFVCGRLCDWDEDGRETRTMMGEQPECPHCAGATAARQERGKRALGVGKLRPDIVLYGEEHPSSDLISPIVQHDLSAGPDLLLVLGTSLRVHGLKPSESTWGDVIDYWIEWDCDAWVEDLRLRKPTLWMSPEEALEYEKQKREDIAAEKERKKESLAAEKAAEKEKKRESLAAEKERKRESLAAEKEKRRESLAAEKVKKRESLAAERDKRREAAENRRRELEERREAAVKGGAKPFRSRTIWTRAQSPVSLDVSPRTPNTGETTMHVVLTLCTLSPRPFSRSVANNSIFLATPPPRPQTSSSSPGRVVQPKPKRPRKSAPAAFFTHSSEGPDQEDTPRAKPPNKSHLEKRLQDMPQLTRWSPSPAPPTSYPNSSKAQYRKAAWELRNSATPPPQRMSELYNSYGSYRDYQKQWARKLPPGARDDDASMRIEGPPSVLPVPVKMEELSGSTPATIGAAVKTNPRIRKPKLIDGEPVNILGTTRTRARPVAQAPVVMHVEEEDIILPKLPPMLNLKAGTGPRLETMEPVPDVSPLKTLSPNQRYFGLDHWHHPLRVSNPLAHWQTASRASSERDLLPSPSDQLREETEAAATTTTTENFTGYVTPFSDLSEA
ncbi:hypothetical protein PG989_004856 [Apiospora arundinis]